MIFYYSIKVITKLKASITLDVVANVESQMDF